MSFINQWKQTPLLLLPTACKVCPYGISGRCNGPTTLESVHRRDVHVIGCHDPKRITEYFADIYGTHYPKLQTAHQERIVLPPFIPIITDGIPETLRCGDQIVFAVSLGNILNQRGDLKVQTSAELRQFLKLPLDARVALICTGDDHLLECFWALSNSRNLWSRIAALGFEFVTSCTFSVWDQQPRFDQIANQDRNFLSFDAFVREGVATIPFLFFYDELDYQYVISWLKCRPYINKVAMLTQCRPKHDVEFSEFLQEMRSIADDVGRPLEFLVVGPSSQKRISAILSKFDASIATSKPFYAALHGERTASDLSHKTERNTKISRPQLAVDNIKTYTINCTEAEKERKQCIPKSITSPIFTPTQLSLDW